MFTDTDRFIVLDTETTNTIDEPIMYDLGFLVCDIHGTVYETHSLVISDVFNDESLMASAYYYNKIPQYKQEIASGQRKLVSLYEARMILCAVAQKYDAKLVVAHNAYFDYRSTNRTQRYLTKSRYRFFLPYGVELWDSLKMARATFKDDENYAEFCKQHEYLTQNGKPQYTAEVLYRYLHNDTEFAESHTGLEDCMIEKEIFTACLSRNPDLDGIAFPRPVVEPEYWWQK